MSLLSQMSAFASPEKAEQIDFARQLERAAAGRRDAGDGEQPEPEMFGESTPELRAWREAYGGNGRKSTWPKRMNQKAASGATSPSMTSETFALTATKRCDKPMPVKGSTGTKATATTGPRSNPASTTPKATTDKRLVLSETAKGREDVAAFMSIGLRRAEAERVVNLKWELASLFIQISRPDDVEEHVWRRVKSADEKSIFAVV